MNTPFTTDSWLEGLPAIVAVIQRTRRRLAWHRSLTGTILAAAWLAAGLLIAVTLDILSPLPVVLRAAAAIIASLPAAAIWAIAGIRPLLAPPSYAHVAYAIETALGGMHNRLITCLDLAQRPATRSLFSQAFCRKLVEETARRLEPFKPPMILDRRLATRAGIAAGCSLLILALLLALFPARALTALNRIAAPLADLPPVSSVAYTVAPGATRMLLSDDFTVVATVQKGFPDDLRLVVMPDRGASITHPCLPVNPSVSNTFGAVLRAVEGSFRYRITGGGTWSKEYRVEVLSRPQLAGLKTRVFYPAYMGITNAWESPPQSADANGPAGGIVEIVARVRGDAVRGRIERLEGAPEQFQGALAGNIFSNPGVIRTAMSAAPGGLWTGRVPLDTSGVYQVTFENALGYANKPMNPARLVAFHDSPPQIAFDRPNADLVLGRDSRIPLVIAASDDYGLAAIRLAILTTGTNVAAAVDVAAYARPVLSDTAASVLDPTNLPVKIGDYFRYRGEAVDRRGQVARTREFSVRLTSGGPQAVETQLSKSQDATSIFLGRMDNLITTQRMVRLAIDRLAATSRVFLATRPTNFQAAAELAAGATNILPFMIPGVTNSRTQGQIDLDTFRTSLTAMAALQVRNRDMARAMSEALSNAVFQSAASPLMPAPLNNQMSMLQESFESFALQPMQTLADAMQKAAAEPTAPAAAGELQRLQAMSDRLQRDLEALRQSAEATDQAVEQIQRDPAQALELAETARKQTQAGILAGDLERLNELLDLMAAEMERLGLREEKLLEGLAGSTNFPAQAATNLHSEVARQAEPLLEFTRRLQDQEAARAQKKRPDFPSAPYTPEQDSYRVPQHEADTPEPSTNKAAAESEKDGKNNRDKTGEEQEEDELFMPALGGPQPTLDPRLADKRPAPPGQPEGDDASSKSQKETERQGWQLVKELDMARKSARSDQAAAADLANQLRQAMGGAKNSRSEQPQPSSPSSQSSRQQGQPMASASQSQQQGQPSAQSPQQAQQQQQAPAAPAQPAPQQPQMQQPTPAPQSAQQQAQPQAHPTMPFPQPPSSPSQQQQPSQAGADLDAINRLMQSPQMQNAAQMAERMHSLGGRTAQNPGFMGQLASWLKSWGGGGGGRRTENDTPDTADLPELDVKTRQVILQLQPRLRDELLQGMREEGPAAYRQFIEGYYRDLTRIKEAR